VQATIMRFVSKNTAPSCPRAAALGGNETRRGRCSSGYFGERPQQQPEQFPVAKDMDVLIMWGGRTSASAKGADEG